MASAASPPSRGRHQFSQGVHRPALVRVMVNTQLPATADTAPFSAPVMTPLHGIPKLPPGPLDHILGTGMERPMGPRWLIGRSREDTVFTRGATWERSMRAPRLSCPRRLNRRWEEMP